MSNHYLLPCSCGKKLPVSAAQAGAGVTCACGQKLRVPTLRGLRELEPARAESPVRTAPGWSLAHGLCFSGGLLLILAGIALVAFHLNRYRLASAYTTDRTDAVVAAHTADVDGLTATQMLDEWSKMVSDGLGEKMTPPWEAAKQMVASNVFWIKTGGALVAAGLALSVLSLFVARPRAA